MPLTRGYTDEIKELNAEPIIGSAKNELLDDTISRIAKHIDIPLRLYASATPDQYLNIGASLVEAGDGAGKATPPVDSALPVIAGGQIGFTAKTAPAFVKLDGGTFTFPTTTLGQYRRLAFSVDGLGNLNAVWSAAAASIAALTDPGLLHAQMAGVPVGYLDLEALAAAGTYKTAGSTTDVIENKVGADIRIFRYGSGSGSGGAGGGASLLDPNYDETFIYYTRSDFAIDKKEFFSSTDGTENILGLGKVVLDQREQFISANLLGPVFLADNPVINTAQVRLLYKEGKVDGVNGSVYLFAIPAASGSVFNDDTYTNNGYTFTVRGSVFGGGNITLFCTGTGSPELSGTLTRATGSGAATLAFTSWIPGIGVSYNGGTSWVAPYQVSKSGLFVIADFALPAGTTSTDFRMCVVSYTNASELAGFGVNLVQDNVGAYGGDAAFETRVITSTEASTGLITLTQVKFTPGAHQLHVNYNGHDFMAPDFIELGGGQVQFPLSFFTAGDVAKFYVGYGMINQTNAPTTINNMLSSNSTLGSVQVPSGFTLDKPYMEIPAGATVSGAGNVETTGVITGDGILATTGSVLSTGYEPTQPKADRVEEATAGKGVGIQGRTDGGGARPGDIGETALAKISAGGITILAANTDTDVPGLALPLTKGVWLVGYNVCTATYNNTGSAINLHGRLKITDSSNNLFSGSECLIGKDGLVTATSIYFSATRSLPIVLSADTVIKVRAAKDHGDTTNARLYIYDTDMFGAFTNPDNNSILWAVRIA
jgi:hypothetical protein